MQNSVSTLAVKSSDGRKAALLVSDYRSTNTSITAEVKGVDLSKKPTAFVLSQKSNAEPRNVSWDGNKVLLEKPDKNSAAFMVVFDL